MRPRKTESERMPQGDLFRARLENLVDVRHELVQLGKKIDWALLETTFGTGFSEVGRPALPVRLVLGLLLLKHSFNLSDELVVERTLENPYWQHFCGFEYFQHKLPCDGSSLTRWRNRLGEEGAQKLLQMTLQVAQEEKLLKISDVAEVTIDTTVQPKNITHPTDAKLLDKARELLVKAAKDRGIELRQSYVRVGKELKFRAARYAHAKQWNRMKSAISKMRTILGRVIRNVRDNHVAPMDEKLVELLKLSIRVHEQRKDSKDKVYSLHEPHVACIAKGKAHKPYEFGSKPSIAVTNRGSWIVGVTNFQGNPYDGSTMKKSIEDVEKITGVSVKTIFADKGYRGKVHWPDGKMVLISGRKKLTKRLKKMLKRRQAVEPVIGHCKAEHRLVRNFLKGVLGDAINALMAGVGFNMKKILRALRLLFVFCMLRLWRRWSLPQEARLGYA